MFKRLRVAILLFVLFVVAFNQLLAGWRSRNWDDPLRVGIWLVNGDGSAATAGYLDTLDSSAFADIEQFFAEEARAYGVELDLPFRIRLAGELDEAPPAAPGQGGGLDVLVWSLRMRWFVTGLHFAYDGPTPDITLFAVYREGGEDVTIDRSTALRKGLIAIANVYAVPAMHGSNQLVMAHEVLHTLGAADKYDFATGLPLYPAGFADPDRSPLYPQERAELMAGRVALSPSEAATAYSLALATIGPATAYEIGWTGTPPRSYARPKP